jgi:hypothetical protein
VASLTAGLVDVLRAFLPGGYPPEEMPLDFELVIDPLSCLSRLIGETEEDDSSRELMGPAMDARIVAVLTEVVKKRDEKTIVCLLVLVRSVLLAVPQGGAGGLPRAIAGLLTSDGPQTLVIATNTLLCIALMRPDLIKDWHTWGMDDTLERLTLNNDKRTAAAARELLSLVNLMVDVSMPHRSMSTKSRIQQTCDMNAHASTPAQQGCGETDRQRERERERERERGRECVTRPCPGCLCLFIHACLFPVLLIIQPALATQTWWKRRCCQ